MLVISQLNFVSFLKATDTDIKYVCRESVAIFSRQFSIDMTLDENGKEYIECIVGNIIGDHYWGEQKEIKSGTKHFRAGAKVYCVFMYGGMGHEQVRVMGKPRKSSRMIDVVIRTSYIKNFLLQKVYDPKIIQFLKKYPSSGLATERSLKGLNEHNAEIRKENENQFAETSATE